MLNRRHCLIAIGKAAFAAGLPLPAMAAPPHFFGTAGAELGLQLFMLDAQARTDLEGTLRAVASMGYREVEIANLYGRSGGTIAAMLRAAGLSCPSIHVQGRSRGDDAPSFDGPLGALVGDAQAIGARTLTLASFRFPDDAPARLPDERLRKYVARIGNLMDAGAWRRNADFLNRTGAMLAREGLRIGYHNHNAEFAPLPEGGCGMDILLGETDPACVDFELDVGWVAAAARDPIALLRAHPGRFTQLHVKDVAAATPDYAFVQKSAPLGLGVLDWREILPVARKAGAVHYFFEQDPPYEEDPAGIAARAHSYLAALPT